MDAVYDILVRSPTDDRVILAAVGVAERQGGWERFLHILSRDTLKYDFASRVYLESYVKCLRRTDVTRWPLNHIQQVMVALCPRWGSLIPRDSLSSLISLVMVLVTNGLAVTGPAMSTAASGIPRSVTEALRSCKEEILRMLWYCSALPVMFATLKCTSGENDDSIENVLLKHNADNETHRQSVVTAQERSLECLVAMLVAGRDPALNQLGQVLRQAGQDKTDSASLPLPISVASFVAGTCGVKVRGATVDAAAECLSGLIDGAEVSPSIFTTRGKSLISQMIDALIEGVKERKSQSCVHLLNTLISRLPSIGLESEPIINAVQLYQELHASAGAIETMTTVKDTIEKPEGVLTSGRAIMLARLNDKTKTGPFLEASLGSPDWIKTNLLLEDWELQKLSNFFSLLQSLRIRPEWVLNPLVNEPSLTHLVRFLKETPSLNLCDMGIEVCELNQVLRRMESSKNLGKSCKLLLASYDKQTPDSEVMERIQLAVLSVLATVDVERVRELPIVVENLLEVLELVSQSRVGASGLGIKTPWTMKPESRSILFNLIVNAIGFANYKPHAAMLEVAFRCVAYLTLGGDKNDDESVISLIEHILTSLSPATAVNSVPSVLSCLEALIQTTASLDTARKTHVVDYLMALVAEVSRSSSIQKHVMVSLLSLLSSTLIVSDSVNIGKCEGIWTLLACHSVIQEAAPAASWHAAKLKYSTSHLIWVHTLNMGVVLLSLGVVSGASRFLSVFGDLMTERFSTAHTSDLATLEEACLISRLYELAPSVNKPLPPPFQLTALVTPKPLSMYPKSRAEKLAGNLPSLFEDDVRSPCLVPSVFAQRTVWIAADTLASSLRRIARMETSDSSLFHSLLDCSHFVVQYLAEVGSHRSRILRTIELDGMSYVPLSVQLSVDGRDLKNVVPTRKSVGASGSLLSSMSSPPLAASKQPPGAASLMDSLTPKNSPKNKDGGSGTPSDSDLKFLPPLPGDCPLRTGLSCIAPALITEDDFKSKLVDVLTLCLLQAARLANTESMIRPLLDLLLTTKSSAAKLPAEAFDIIGHMIEIVTPRHNEMAAMSRTAQRKHSDALHVSPQLKPSLPYHSSNPLGFAALSNIR